MNGFSSPTLQAKIRELEQEQAELNKRMRELKSTVDASALPETRLREILEAITTDTPTGNAAILSIVYRVEVAKDTITIWTILDANPDGTYDWDENGVLITPGIPSGVP